MIAKAVRISIGVLLLSVATSVPDAQAGDQKGTAIGASDDDSTVQAAIAAGIASAPTTPVASENTELASPAEKEVWSAYYSATRFSYQNRADAFRWQAITTKIIFVVVIALVVFGVFLTALQFTRKSTSVTALKASTGGLEITSPLVGVVILTLSLGFFYLYLATVYPIHEVLSVTAAPSHNGP